MTRALAGLSPLALVATTLVTNGYSPMPIQPGGKAPGACGGGAWFGLREWTRYCHRPPTALEIQHWSRWPDANVGVACGYGGLIAIDIDRDDLVDAILAVLPPAMVAKKGRRGVTAFYQGDTNVIRSAGFPGMLDLLSRDKQAVLPPSVHPDTGEPYVYTTDRTLLNTPIAELPTIDESHVAAIRELLRLRGGECEPSLAAELRDRPTLTRARGGGARSRTVNDAALVSLHAWVPNLGLPKIKRRGGGFRAVADWTASGTGKPLARRDATLSIHPTGIVDWGDADRGYTPIDLVGAALRLPYDEAQAWLAERLGIDLTAPVADEAYRDMRALAPAPARPRSRIDLARKEVAKDANVFFAEAQRFKNERALFANGDRSDPPVPFNLLSPTETGVGKSMAAIGGCGRGVPTGLAVGYAIPITERGDEFVEDFKRVGLRARVYRGRERDDLEARGHKMCRNLASVKAAREADASIYDSCCEKDKIRCPHFGECGYLKQRRDLPDVWIVPHALLAFERPDFIPLDALIIDESFHKITYSSDPETMKVDEYSHGPLPLFASMRAPLADFRRRVAVACASAPDGFLMREALDAAGVTLASAKTAQAFEETLKRDPGLSPDLPILESGRRSASVAKHNADVKTRVALAEAIVELLASEKAGSGRVTVAFDEKEQVRKFHIRRLTPVNKSWRVPTWIIDATPPSRAVLEIAIVGNIIERPPVKADWSQFVLVRRYVGANVSASGLGNVESNRKKTSGDEAKREKQLLRDIYRLINVRAAEFCGETIGIIGPEKALNKLKKMGLPKNVETKNFTTAEGFNGWKTTPYLLVFGFSRVPPRPLESAAGCLMGEPPKQLPSEDGKPVYGYPQRPAGILLKDGRVVPTERDEHPDPVVEALRARACEGGLEQAVGRVRPHDRTAETPCLVEIIGDMPLDIPVDEVLDWSTAKPGIAADLAPEGVLLLNDIDLQDALGVARGKVRVRRKVDDGDFLLIESIRVFRHRGLSSKRVAFKRHGAQFQRSTAMVLPNGPKGRPEIRRHLERLLGRLDELAIEGEHRMFAAVGATVAARLAAKAPPDFSLGATVGRLAEIGFDTSMLAAIHEKGENGATRDELLRSALRPNAARRDASLKRLIAAHSIDEIPNRGRGRPSKRYVVLPDKDE